MQITESCEVCSRKGKLYYVKLVKNAKCDGCKACGFGCKNYLVMPALSQIDCAVGDRVEISMPERRVKGSYVYLYLLPLILTFIGIMMPFGHGEAWMLMGGAIGLAASVPAVYLIELAFRRKKKYLPVILRKISETKETDND